MYYTEREDTAKTFFYLVKSNDGFFKSTKQASFLLKRLRGDDITKMYHSDLKKAVNFDPNSQMAFVYMWDLGFGRTDTSKIRYACALFILDSQGVIFRYKVGVNHKPGSDQAFQPNFKKLQKVWERSSSEIPFPEFSFFEKERKEIAVREALFQKKLKPLADKIRSTVPEEDFKRSSFLSSILHQLEVEKRSLSEPQMVALNNVFEKYGVGVENLEGYLSEGVDRWKADYKSLASFLFSNFQEFLAERRRMDEEFHLKEHGNLDGLEPEGLWATETHLQEFLQGHANNDFGSFFERVIHDQASPFIRKIAKARMLYLYDYTGQVAAAIKKKGKRLSKKQQKAIMLLPEFLKVCKKVLSADNLISEWDSYYLG
jgi:hypothetical protein